MVPMNAPAMKNTRMTAPLLAPIVRRIAISPPLSFTSMIQAGDDVQRCDQYDQRKDQEHHIPLDRQGAKKAGIHLLPIDQAGCGSGGALYGRPPGGNFIGLGDHHFDALNRVIQAEK